MQRKSKRFLEDFMFVLTRGMGTSQIVTSSEIKYSKLVHAFTDKGIAMFTAVNAQPIQLRLGLKLKRLKQLTASHFLSPLAKRLDMS